MHVSLTAEKIGTLFGLPITNSLLMTWLAMIILIVIGVIAGHKPTMVPKRIQNFLEAIIEYAENLMDSVLQDKALTERVFPLVATLFLLIILSNWLGLLPGVGPIGFLETHNGETVLVPLLRSANADINSTLSLAIISVVSIQLFGIVSLGVLPHIGRFINLRSLFKGTFEGIIEFSVGLLEIISEISRLISFSFRLFGNVFAGEVLLTVIAFLVPYLAPLPFYFLELFVGLIQGLVFVTLTLVFIKIAVTSHGQHDEHPKQLASI